MKDLYKKHRKTVVLGAIILAVLILAALFTAGAWFVAGRSGVQYGVLGEPVVFSSKAIYRESSVDSASIAVNRSGILPPVPVVPASGFVDPSVERKIIKNANMEMVVKNTENTIEEIKTIVKANKGFISNSSVWETGDKKRGNISVRVPEDVFDIVLESIKSLGIKIIREDISTQDVTEQFIDLQAQLKNYKATEAQYLKVLNRAYTVEDILKVRKELDRVRGNIERMQGRINYLSRQIAMSTISVSLIAEADVKVLGIVWSPWLEIKAGIRDMLIGIVSFINSLIAFVFKLPIIILWTATLAVVVWAGWKGFVIIRRKLF